MPLTFYEWRPERRRPDPLEAAMRRGRARRRKRRARARRLNLLMMIGFVAAMWAAAFVAIAATYQRL